jgi:O-antigen/teichoic acid export membrane protein
MQVHSRPQLLYRQQEDVIYLLMSDIRRQSIISSFIVYFGFALGFFNTFLYTKEGSFPAEGYGLVVLFNSIANIMLSLASLGSPAVISKFYPYYKDNLPRDRNDLFSISLLMSVAGFAVILIAGFFLKDLVVKKFVTNSPELVTYYYWLFPFGFGLTIYSVLEAYAWQERRSVFTNLLREFVFRVMATLLLLLFFAGIISGLSAYIKLYSITYLLLALILLFYLLGTGKIAFTFSISKVTKRFYKKMALLAAFMWSGGVVNIAKVFDAVIIASVLPGGQALVGVYAFAENVASLIQAPQRGIISASIAPLSRAWKDKDYEKINNIYKRSSINQLIFSVAMFSLIYMNFIDGVLTVPLKETYLKALPVFLFYGVMRIMDMGTGVNAQIIATSIYWRFEFFTGILLLALSIPLTYLLTKEFGIIGTAVSNLIAFTIYNFIRGAFLWKKLKMQPFSIKSLYTVLLGIICYAVCYYLLRSYAGWPGIFARSILFMVLYGTGVIYLKLTPDFFHVVASVRKRFAKTT